MLDVSGAQAVPHIWSEIERRTAELGFDMPSDMRTKALLKALAASKPHGRLLELGTGTGPVDGGGVRDAEGAGQRHRISRHDDRPCAREVRSR